MEEENKEEPKESKVEHDHNTLAIILMSLNDFKTIMEAKVTEIRELLASNNTVKYKKNHLEAYEEILRIYHSCFKRVK